MGYSLGHVRYMGYARYLDVCEIIFAVSENDNDKRIERPCYLPHCQPVCMIIWLKA